MLTGTVWVLATAPAVGVASIRKVSQRTSPTTSIPTLLIVIRVALDCAALPDPNGVGVWKIRLDGAPDPVPRPAENVRLPPAMFVPAALAPRNWKLPTLAVPLPEPKAATVELKKLA